MSVYKNNQKGKSKKKYKYSKRKYTKKVNKKRTQKNRHIGGSTNGLSNSNILKSMKGKKFYLPSYSRFTSKKITRGSDPTKGHMNSISNKIQERFNQILEKDNIKILSPDESIVQNIYIPILKNSQQPQSFKVSTNATLNIEISKNDTSNHTSLDEKIEARGKKIIERITMIRNYYLLKYIKKIPKLERNFFLFINKHENLYKLLGEPQNDEDLKKALILLQDSLKIKDKKQLKKELVGLKNFMKTEKKQVKNLVTLIRKNYIYDSNLLKLLLWTQNIYLRVTYLIIDILSGIEQEYLYVFFDEFNKAIEDINNPEINIKDEIIITFYMLLPKTITINFNLVENGNTDIAELHNNNLNINLNNEIENLKSSINKQNNNIQELDFEFSENNNQENTGENLESEDVRNPENGNVEGENLEGENLENNENGNNVNLSEDGRNPENGSPENKNN